MFKGGERFCVEFVFWWIKKFVVDMLLLFWVKRTVFFCLCDMPYILMFLVIYVLTSAIASVLTIVSLMALVEFLLIYASGSLWVLRWFYIYSLDFYWWYFIMGIWLNIKRIILYLTKMGSLLRFLLKRINEILFYYLRII